MRMILALLVLLTAAPAYANPMLLAVMGASPYDLTTFENATISPWSGWSLNGNSSDSHNSTYSAAANVAASGTATLSRTMDTAAGTLGFWIKVNGSYNTAVAVKIAGVTAYSQTGTISTTWSYISGTITAGSSHLVEIAVTNLSGGQVLYNIDDISVPVP